MRTTPHYDPFLVNPRSIIDPTPDAYDPGALPGVIHPRGQAPDVPFSPVVHTHIKPSFSRNTNLDEFGIPKLENAGAARARVQSIGKWMKDPWSGPAATPWQKAFPATLHSQSKPITLTLTIQPFKPDAYPQHHRLLLSSVDLSPFARWTYDLTPFSLRSFARGAGWEGYDDEQELGRVLGGFVGGIRERVAACCADPKRFKARLDHTSSKHTATLTFVEIIRDYRETELFTTDFTTAPWSEIVEDVTTEYDRAEAHNTLVKTALMQALELVARHQPGLLLAQNPDPPPWEMYPATPSFGKLWNYLTSLDPMNVEEERDDDEDSKVIYEKAFPILIRHSQPLLPEKKLLSISVTYTHTPPEYILTLTDPTDPFIHHQSKPITPDLFRSLTSHFTLLPSHATTTSGFTPTDGSTFLTFLIEECIDKVISEPSRYKSILEIHSSRWEEEEEQVLTRRRTPPVRRSSTLRFEEKVSRWNPVRDVVRFEFRENEWDVVAEAVKKRLESVRHSTEVTMSRLSRLLTLTLHTKNTALLSALQRKVGKLPPMLMPNFTQYPNRPIGGAAKAHKIYHNRRYPSPERPPSSASIMLPMRESRTGKGCFIPVFAGTEEGSVSGDGSESESEKSTRVWDWRKRVVGWEGRAPSSLAGRGRAAEDREERRPVKSDNTYRSADGAWGCQSRTRGSSNADSGVDVRSLRDRASPHKSRWSDSGDEVAYGPSDRDSERPSASPSLAPDLLVMSGWRGADHEW